MSDLKVTVKYDSVPAKVVLAVVVCLLPIWGIMAPFVVLMLIYALMTTASLPDPQTLAQIFAFCVVMISTCVAGISGVLNFADRRIIASKSGLLLPTFLSPMLGWHRNFHWQTITGLKLEEDTVFGGKRLVVYGPEGCRPALDVSRMDEAGLEQLLVAFDVWAPDVPKDSGLVALQDRLEKKPQGDRALSYTEMWESELSQRFSSTSFVPLEPDMLLQDGRLKVLSQLSFGGLSAIYLCQRHSRELVVLKEAVVPDGTNEQIQAKAREMFDREAQFLMRLDHPNIVKVLDHFAENGRNYLLLEYVNGQDLRQYVRQHGPQPEQKVVSWAIEIASILSYLHSQDPPIVHRDISPDNLVLDKDDRLMLIDFGAANEFVGTATGTLVGKQAFISPEQFRGKAGPPSDIYAMGGLLHFLVTGADPEPLSVSNPQSLNPAVSAEFDETVANMTQLEIIDRIETAEDVLGRLSAIKDHATGVC